MNKPGYIAPLKRIEMSFKRLVFVPIQLMLHDGDTAKPVPHRTTIQRILLLRPEPKIGDWVISLPSIRHLRKSFPDAEIDIVCSIRNRTIVSTEASLNSVMCYRKNIIRDVLEVMRLRKKKYDVVIDLLYHDSLTTLILSQACAPGAYRIGGGKRRFRRFYDWSAAWADDHIVDCTLSLLRPLGIDIAEASRHEPLADSSDCRARAATLAQGIRGHQSTVIGVNVSAGTATRTWGKEKYTMLIHRMMSNLPNVVVVILGTPSDRVAYASLGSEFPGRVSIPTNGNSIEDASALIRELDFVISPDTAMVHIARSHRVPVVGLYTANVSNRLKFQPLGEGNVTVISNHENNVFDITVDQVATAAESMLGRINSRKVHPA